MLENLYKISTEIFRQKYQQNSFQNRICTYSDLSLTKHFTSIQPACHYKSVSASNMMEDSDILTLGWGCEPASNLWHHAGEEFVTLDVEDTKESHEFATLEVAKERDRQFYNSCVDTDKIHQVIPPLDFCLVLGLKSITLWNNKLALETDHGTVYFRIGIFWDLMRRLICSNQRPEFFLHPLQYIQHRFLLFPPSRCPPSQWRSSMLTTSTSPRGRPATRPTSLRTTRTALTRGSGWEWEWSTNNIKNLLIKHTLHISNNLAIHHLPTLPLWRILTSDTQSVVQSVESLFVMVPSFLRRDTTWPRKESGQVRKPKPNRSRRRNLPRSRSTTRRWLPTLTWQWTKITTCVPSATWSSNSQATPEDISLQFTGMRRTMSVLSARQSLDER